MNCALYLDFVELLLRSTIKINEFILYCTHFFVPLHPQKIESLTSDPSPRGKKGSSHLIGGINGK